MPLSLASLASALGLINVSEDKPAMATAAEEAKKEERGMKVRRLSHRAWPMHSSLISPFPFLICSPCRRICESATFDPNCQRDLVPASRPHTRDPADALRLVPDLVVDSTMLQGFEWECEGGGVHWKK